MKQNRFILFLYRFSLFFLLCMGIHAWFVWDITTDSDGVNQLLYSVLFAIPAFLHKRINHVKSEWNSQSLLLVILWMLAYCYPHFSPFYILVSPFKLYPLLVLAWDYENIKGNLKFISVALAVLLVPGIIVWLVQTVTGIIIPGPIIQHPAADSYMFFNNIISLNQVYNIDEHNVGFARFQSVALEPGYLGTLLAFMLYANQFKMKQWYNIIIFVSLIITLSLAGYVIAGLAYIFINLNSRNVWRNTILALSVIGLVWIIGVNYNGGNNLINNVIIERLSFDSEKGVSGNNRFFGDTDVVFDECIENGTFITGNPKLNADEGVKGAGYKIFIIQRGLIGCLFFLLFYIFAIRYSGNRRYGLLFLLLIILTFLQAGYPESYSWLIPFFLGISCCKYYNE